ncbi:hypothetical protein GCM10010392_41850 [Streptomyces clavifer]|nr:hypothetical protein GCM10010392_41850 [Streptomyces clavifer]
MCEHFSDFVLHILGVVARAVHKHHEAMLDEAWVGGRGSTAGPRAPPADACGVGQSADVAVSNSGGDKPPHRDVPVPIGAPAPKFGRNPGLEELPHHGHDDEVVLGAGGA